ncbi:transferase, Chloramphenicol acetyltransferase-like domain protein [Artemisia annua]|uniref:Transferase, Chloramphenicol acetyltransferase-like domain protein n=1 Tax=Artemisia annua TaxID=35608 RepID=A0A2U1KHP1_ARTAN|nr:transferase, Chloramphenicol acetyltransferase-like domain protein [Artemisia annua]
MEIKNNASKLIKPSTPTPSTLRNYNISFFDEQQACINVPIILYYSTLQSDNSVIIFDHFEISLSKALTIFYPLAGRYVRENSFIDCSDQGALYVQAKATFQLTEFLGLPWELKFSMLNKFLACEIHEAGEIHHPLLSAKVTSFKCGGFALSMSFSHKFADMSTICTFIDTLSTISQEMDNTLKLAKHAPNFNVAHHYLKRGLNPCPVTIRSSMEAKISVRTFLFKGEAIAKMRKKLNVKPNGSHRPSKVQVVESLLWKAFVSIDKANNGQFNVSTLTQSVDLRNKVVPKLPNNSCGNFFTLANARIDPREGQNIDLQEFYDVLHESIKNINNNYTKAVTPGGKEYEVLLKPFLEYYEMYNDNDINAYSFTSWCKFSWQNADFGWGKPVWKSVGKMETQNFVIMMDDQEGDGVEAWVHLDEKRMCQLEQDPDIRTYAFLAQ